MSTLSALLGWVSCFAADAGDNAPGNVEAISVHCLTENKKVIPLCWQCGQFWTTQIKLPDLVLANHGTDPITPCELEAVGMAEGREVAVNRIADDLGGFVRQVNVQFKKLLGDSVLDRVFIPRSATGSGTMLFEKTKLSDSEVVNPGECAVILLSHALFLSYTGLAKVDDFRVTLTVQEGANRKTIPCPINFVPYQTKGDYIFPMKGDLCVVSLPMNIAQHRKALSQEFAFDVLAAGMIEKGQGPGAGKAGKQALGDYPIFHREVMAIGNGMVVEVGDKFPEAEMSDPSKYTEQRYEELMAKLEPDIGFLSCVAGNYIVIDHENGEFSAYCHLSEGTIRVKPGDRVAKGDVIAAVGNTGHSTEPHLHFQLMDAKDFLIANGLPVMFSNVPASTINQNCHAANSLLATDYVMLRVDG